MSGLLFDIVNIRLWVEERNTTMNDVAKSETAKPMLDYDNLQFHPLANIFDLIDGDEFDAFVDMFRKQGLLQQIILHQGMILEGRNRYRAGKQCGHKWTSKDFTELPLTKNPYEFVIAANVQRRHLTSDQKRNLAVRLIRERPNDSDRKIALLIGVSNKTISTYRKELEEAVDKIVQAWRDLDPVQRSGLRKGKHRWPDARRPICCAQGSGCGANLFRKDQRRSDASPLRWSGRFNAA